MGLRILLTSDHYPPYIGGAHRQTQLLGQELQKRGHEVGVATVWQPGLPEREEDSAITVYRIKQIRTCLPWLQQGGGQHHQPPFPDPVTILGLRRLIDGFKPDLIHAYGWISYSAAAALFGKNIPLLISARDYGYSCATRSLLFEEKTCSGPSFEKCLRCAAGFYGPLKGATAVLGVFSGQGLLLRKMRGLHSVSRYVQEVMKRDLAAWNGSFWETQGGSMIESVIPSFLISSNTNKSDPAFLALLPDTPFILFVGGLQHRKGLGFLLEAYELLASPPQLVLIGYSTKEMPGKLPAGVRLYQDVSHANVMTAWSRCLFGVVPSLWPDPSPGVIREAMSQGKALIVTRVGGSIEMISDNENGLLIPPGDVNVLSSAMQRLIDDSSLRERLGRAAREWASQYVADVVVPQFEHLYQQLLYYSSKSTKGDSVYAKFEHPL
jgi:glycosyltransferase involved in cell wall biosynthesis